VDDAPIAAGAGRAGAIDVSPGVPAWTDCFGNPAGGRAGEDAETQVDRERRVVAVRSRNG